MISKVYISMLGWGDIFKARNVAEEIDIFVAFFDGVAANCYSILKGNPRI